MPDSRVLDYWESFLATRADGDELRVRGYLAERFGDSAQLANELSALIVSGVKTATCSSVWEWGHTGGALPSEGLMTIVLDGSWAPMCIIETVSVAMMAYQDVTPEIAYAEGEGDRTLEYWRRVHWDYFSRVLPKLGHEPGLEMVLACEHFRVVHR